MMIRPNVRASFGRAEAEILSALAGPDGERRLSEEGIDALLDDAEVVRRMLKTPELWSAPAPLIFYLLVRNALLEREIVDRELADYTAALLLEFGKQDRAHRIGDGDPQRFFYLTDIITALGRARGEREHQLHIHLGNFALWLAGVFPDRINHRVHRRGGPPISYYDQLGAAGFRSAAATDLALRYGLSRLFVLAAERFPDLRAALNSLSDLYFFPRPSDPDARILRQVRDDFLQSLG